MHGGKARRRPARPLPRDVEADWARERQEADRCRAKQWFATESEARAFALMHRTQWGEDRTPYACDRCDGWHLASRR